MKKLFYSFLTVYLWFVVSVFPVHGAEVYEYGDLDYIILPDGTVSIDDYYGPASYIIIPEYIDGRPVTQIGDYAFCWCDEVWGVSIPQTVTSIGKYAFSSSGLTSITIPSNVASIGEDAFSDCENLTTVILSDRMTEVSDYLFSYCPKLTNVVLPTSITSIGYGAFYECSGLKAIGIPSSIRTIEGSAFEGCSSLISIQIPSGVTELGWDTFANCSSLQYVALPFTITDIDIGTFEGCISLREIKLPDNIDTISNSTFKNCVNLSKIQVPARLKSIYSDAFLGCNNLSHIYYSGSMNMWNELYVGDGNEVLSRVTVQNDYISPFWDVFPGDWYYDSIIFANNNGYVTGLNNLYFGPYQALSRAQFATILYRMSGSPVMGYVSVFPDVAAGQWYTDAVMWAYVTGVINGYENGMFGPADMITREQMALMMYRYANYLNKNTNEKVDYSSYLDASNVSPFAVDSIQWAVGTNIITGKSNGTLLDAQGMTSRAECAVIIERFLGYYVNH